MEEIWRDIEGYYGYYQVSNFGNVRSLDRYLVFNGTISLRKGKVLTQHTEKKGYKVVTLSKDNKQKVYKVHRLVAEAFIQNPDNLPQVNHKDEDKTNNCVYNLEFCTQKYNLNYGTRTERMIQSRNGTTKPKSVLQFTKNGEFIKEYPSTCEASRQTGINQSNISACCRGHKRYRHAGGFIWKFK